MLTVGYLMAVLTIRLAQFRYFSRTLLHHHFRGIQRLPNFGRNPFNQLNSRLIAHCCQWSFRVPKKSIITLTIPQLFLQR